MAKLSIKELERFLTQRCPRRPSPLIKKAALSGGSLGLISFGIIFTLFSLPFIIIFFPWRIHHEVLMMRSKLATTPGVVTKAPDSNMRVNDRPVYTTHFTFSVEERKYEGVSYSIGRRHSPNQSVLIEYVPGAAHIARITGTAISQTGFFGLFVIIFPMAGLGVLCGGYFSYRNKMRILCYGAFATGKVSDVSPTNMQINRQTVYEIDIEFKTNRGIEQHSKYSTHSQSDIAMARNKQQAGDAVGVLYLPEKPEKVLFIDTLVKQT